MNSVNEFNAKLNQTTPMRRHSVRKDVKIITSQMLFCDFQLVEIHHGSEIYQLRLTKAGKMILTK